MVKKKTNGPEMQVSQEIIANLRPNEKILWNDKPFFHPLTPLAPIDVVGFPLLFSLLFILILAYITFTFVGDIHGGFSCFTYLLFFGVILIFFLSYYISYMLLIKNSEYVLTNQRLILLRGVISRQLKFVEFDDILCIDVRVGRFERIFGTGSIYFGLPTILLEHTHFSKVQYTVREMLVSVKEPYEVHNLIRDTIEQNKTENAPTMTMIEAKISKRQMPCPKCKIKLEFPNMESDINIRCPKCNHTFPQPK